MWFLPFVRVLQFASFYFNTGSFHLTFLNTLTTFERYVHLGHTSQLGETVRECVKNVMLVLSASGVFDPAQYSTGPELWELAWAVIDPFYPALRADLGPGPQAIVQKVPEVLAAAVMDVAPNAVVGGPENMNVRDAPCVPDDNALPLVS